MSNSTMGNANTDGVTPGVQKTAGPSTPPGTVTRGPGKNKPRVHLVSSKGKIPAQVVAHALANKQAKQAGQRSPSPKGTGPTNLPNDTQGQTTADVHTQQLKNPKGVAPRPAPKHQNNPAYAGSFTPQGKRYAQWEKAQPRVVHVVMGKNRKV